MRAISEIRKCKRITSVDRVEHWQVTQSTDIATSTSEVFELQYIDSGTLLTIGLLESQSEVSVHEFTEGETTPVVPSLSLAMVVTDSAHGATTNTRSALEGLGHTVVVVDEDNLGTHDFSSYHAVLTVRALPSQAYADSFKTNVVDIGKPVIIGGLASGVTAGDGRTLGSTFLRLTGTYKVINNTGTARENVVEDNTHPVTDGFVVGSKRIVYTGSNWMGVLNFEEPYVGIGLLSGDPEDVTAGLIAGIAIPANTNDLDGIPFSTERSFVWGDLYAGQTTYDAEGIDLIERMLRWITDTSAS